MERKMILVRDGAAEALRQVMKDEQITQSTLADMAGCKKQAVQQLLTRKNGNMRVTTLVKMLNVMDYDLAIVKGEGKWDLLDGEGLTETEH